MNITKRAPFDVEPDGRTKPTDPRTAAGNKALDDIYALIDASELQERQVGKTAAQVSRMNAEYQIQNDLAKLGVTITEDQEVAIQNLLDEYQAQVKATEELSDQFEKLEQAADQFAEDFGRAFVDSVGSGEDALVSLGRAFKATLLRMAADALIINPLKQIFSPSGGNLFGKALGLFGIPALAEGGPVSAGSPYVVGDGGEPELFVPKSSGIVVPFSKMRGGGTTVTVNQKITLSPDVAPSIAAQIYQAAPLIADEARRRVAEDLAGKIIT